MQAIGVNELPEVRHEVKSTNDEFIVLLGARMLCWKGVDIAIEASRKLENQDKSIKLKIAGVGRNLLRYKKMSEGLSNVEFLEEISHSKMEKLYRNSDVLLNCSLHDSGCMVVLEAMSYGLPIIAIRTGGPSILADDECAIMIDPKPSIEMVEEICDGIVMLKNKSEKRKRLSTNSRNRVESHFMYDQKYNQIIEELERFRCHAEDRNVSC